jgi:hypothetical protein
MGGSDATATEDEEQQGNDREDDENGVQHGPCSTPAGRVPNVDGPKRAGRIEGPRQTYVPDGRTCQTKVQGRPARRGQTPDGARRQTVPGARRCQTRVMDAPVVVVDTPVGHGPR